MVEKLSARVPGVSIRVLAILLIGALCLPAVVAAQKAKTFDYSKNNFGIGGDMGLGIASSSVGAGFQWGASVKLGLHKGFFLEPGFHMYVKSGGWDMCFDPAPRYVLRFAKFPIHPYAGFGPALHIQHATIDNKGATKGRVGLQWGWGGEWVINKQFSVFNDYKYQLILGTPAPDIFTITVGAYFYLY
ncbi:MAG: outer membrane beta-barrel protein [bacterium]